MAEMTKERRQQLMLESVDGPGGYVNQDVLDLLDALAESRAENERLKAREAELRKALEELLILAEKRAERLMGISLSTQSTDQSLHCQGVAYKWDVVIKAVRVAMAPTVGKGGDAA